MAYTNFGKQQPQQKAAWIKEVITQVRSENFFDKFTSTDGNSIVREIRELKKSDKGLTAAYIPMMHALEGTGVSGDRTLEGTEEALNSSWEEVGFDRLRHAAISEGKLAEQKQVLDFRKSAKLELGEWFGDVLTRLQIHTLTGTSYNLKTDSSPVPVLPGQDPLDALSFFADVTPSSAKRHFNWNGTSLEVGDTSAVTPTYKLTYDAILELGAMAQVKRLRPIKAGGKKFFVLLLHPYQMVQLNRDPKFKENLLHAAAKGMDNPIFNGAQGLTFNNIVIHVTDQIFNTTGAAAGAKWGPAGDVDGAAALLLGASALGMVNLYDMYDWIEETYDYKNKHGISVDFMFGMKKLKFKSQIEGGTVEDLGVMRINTAI